MQQPPSPLVGGRRSDRSDPPDNDRRGCRCRSQRVVSTTGSDSNAGTETAPWRTIGHALSALVAGDTLIVHGGTYAEHVPVSLHAGSASAPILVRAAAGERPSVKGLLWLTGPTWWTFDGLNACLA